MKRSTLAAISAVTIVGATGAGWAAASRVKSSAQLAAEAAPPVASLITFSVEKRVLSSDLIIRGTVRYSDPIIVVLAPSVLKPPTLLVSTPPVKGSTLDEGKVAMVVSGRPVLALAGPVPMYRDLGPGMTGDDIRQLETALARMGFNPGPVDGVFDTSTSTAVAAWYAKAGFAPFGPNEVQRTNLRVAQSALSQATDRLLAAKQSEQVARVGVKPADIVDAKANVMLAESAVLTARSVVERDVARSAGDVAAKEAGLRVAVLSQDDTRRKLKLVSDGVNATGSQVAASQIVIGEQVVADAAAAVTVTEADLASSQAVADTVRKLGEASIADAKAKLQAAGVAFGVLTQQQQLDLYNALLTAKSAVVSAEATATKDITVAAADISSKTNAVASAKTKVAQAQGRLDSLRKGIDPASGLPIGRGLDPATGSPYASPADQAAAITALQQADNAVNTAQADLDATKRAVALTVAANDQALSDAKLRVSAATARLRALNAPAIGTKTLTQSVAVAQAEVDRVTQELAKITATVGVQVPANEVVFFPSLPLRIDDTKLKRGDAATTDVMTVSGTKLAIDSSLVTTEASLTKVDAPVTIESAEYSFTTKGHVSFVADKPGLRGTDGQHIALEIAPDDAPAQLVGASVKITIPTQTTKGESLIVPVGALSVRADGATQLQVEDQPGVTRSVIVTAALSAQGFVAITPVTGNLKVGDRVVVGTSGSTSATPALLGATNPLPSSVSGNTPTTVAAVTNGAVSNNASLPSTTGTKNVP